MDVIELDALGTYRRFLNSPALVGRLNFLLVCFTRLAQRHFSKETIADCVNVLNALSVDGSHHRQRNLVSIV